MKIELNPHFKPDESVLYCGNAVYATLQARGEPQVNGGYVRMWKLRARRRGTNMHFYVKLKNGRATFLKGVTSATLFPCYKEANELAERIMESGNVLSVDIIETVSYIYEEDSYAP